MYLTFNVIFPIMYLFLHCSLTVTSVSFTGGHSGSLCRSVTELPDILEILIFGCYKYVLDCKGLSMAIYIF